MAGKAALGNRVPYLDRLDASIRAELLAAGVARSVRPNTVLVIGGDPSTHVFLVLEGWLKVTASSANGHEGLLALRGPGDVVGESAALNGQARSATVATQSAARLVTVPAADFLAILRKRPEAALALAAVLADRQRVADGHRLAAAANSVPERLALLLLDLVEQCGTADPDGTAIAVGFSQRELAGWVGASRESVTRALTDFRERELVTTQRRRVVVRKPEVLRRIAGSA